MAVHWRRSGGPQVTDDIQRAPGRPLERQAALLEQVGFGVRKVGVMKV
jgi:hypothetical protein